jgi:CubicO group peptidase (beta-lactamase class C family)
MGGQRALTGPARLARSTRRQCLWLAAGAAAPWALAGCAAPRAAVAQATPDAGPWRAAADAADLHSLLVWQRGSLQAEIYRRSSDRPSGNWLAREVAFGPEVEHDMRSITKSVVALLVGQAVGRGELDIATPVLDFYPELADLKAGPQREITLAHLLDMASGLAWNEGVGSYGAASNDETRLASDPRPARYVLDRPLVAAPGTLWNYNGGCTAVLGEVLQRRTGRSLPDLARDGLFDPLGITRWTWRRGAHGQPLAYSGLRLTPPDLLTIGRLMLAGGRWNGLALVPAAWVAASLQPRIGTAPGAGRLQYGLQWWHGTADTADGRTLPWTAGYGNGGQRLFLLPGLDLAVVMTAGQYNSDRIGGIELRLFRQIVARL